MRTFAKVVLYTDGDGCARFREEEVLLAKGTPPIRLSPVYPCAGYQLRRSPVGFRSDWHCTPAPQWVFILQGEMEIGLRDGSARGSGPEMHAQRHAAPGQQPHARQLLASHGCSARGRPAGR